jgi:hypothetical protein
VQEGEQPAEDAAELMAEVERLFERQLHLISAINLGRMRILRLMRRRPSPMPSRSATCSARSGT